MICNCSNHSTINKVIDYTMRKGQSFINAIVLWTVGHASMQLVYYYTLKSNHGYTLPLTHLVIVDIVSYTYQVFSV